MRNYAKLLLPLLLAAAGILWTMALLPEQHPLLHETEEHGEGAMSGYMAGRPETLPQEGARAAPPYDPEKPPPEIRRRTQQRQENRRAPHNAVSEPPERDRPEEFGPQGRPHGHPGYGDPEAPPRNPRNPRDLRDPADPADPTDWRGPHGPDGPPPEGRRGPEPPQTPGEVIQEALEPLVPPEP